MPSDLAQDEGKEMGRWTDIREGGSLSGKARSYF